MGKKSIRSTAQICYIHKKVTLLKFFLVILSGKKHKNLVEYDNGDISPAIHKYKYKERTASSSIQDNPATNPIHRQVPDPLDHQVNGSHQSKSHTHLNPANQSYLLLLALETINMTFSSQNSSDLFFIGT